jgi:hypothetical protein
MASALFKYRKIDTGYSEPGYEVTVRGTGEVIGTVQRSAGWTHNGVAYVHWTYTGLNGIHRTLDGERKLRRSYPAKSRERSAIELFQDQFGMEAYRDLVREEAVVV